MLKVGDKLMILYPFSVFCGCTVTVQREYEPGNFVCTTPERPQEACVVPSNGEDLLFIKVDEDDETGDSAEIGLKKYGEAQDDGKR